MKIFWFGVVLLAFCAICEVISDYSDTMLPLKEIRNRVHRTMRMNMRVGKRFGDSEYDEEVPRKVRLRMLARVGKRTPAVAFNFKGLDYIETPYDNSFNHKLRFLQEKRNLENLEQAQLYNEAQEVTLSDNLRPAPKRRLRPVIRTGKRDLNPAITQNTFTPLYTDSSSEDPDINSVNTDFKRSSPQFLLNPRVGKTDKTWKIHSGGNMHKRNDPKATDMWFGPRIGRSSEEPYEDVPWAYVVLNGNRPANSPVFKSNDVEEQSRDDLQE